ncbi:hypothetical protein IAU60_000314 [Kwoniella sp. DSM 27419]
MAIKASSTVPALSTTAGTSTTTSMPVTPRTASPAPTLGEVVDNDEVKPDGIDATKAADLKEELQEELQQDGERDPQAAARADRLTFLLDKSTIYAKIIGDRMERQQVEKRKAEQRAETRKANKEKRGDVSAVGRAGMREKKPTVKEETAATGAKRRRRSEAGREEKKAKMENGDDAKEEAENVLDEPTTNGAEEQVKPEAAGGDNDVADGHDEDVQYSFKQPELVTGATLRDYQLAGVQWMISLYENGLNGILADEMGLGKTLQTISFLAHLRSKGTWGPFLIVCPLSVLNNWVMEFEKFCPTIPVLMYHGTPDHRADLRKTRLQTPTAAGVGGMKKSKAGARGRKSVGAGARAGQNDTSSFPIVVTTFEIAMKDRQFLSGLMWKFIVVDEGHRLKNLDCKLIRELKSYTSANRMILTGTPLHNNLAELWSLLNFILPDIFDDLDAFQQWFNFGEMSNGSAQGLLDKSSVVSSLHAILKPFLLRRLKVDVEKDLPPKKEYLLYAPLTQQQKEIYQAIVSRNIRQYLIDKKSGVKEEDKEDGVETDKSDDEGKEEATDNAPNGRASRKKARVNYKIEENDSKFIRNLENGVRMEEPSGVKEGKSAAQIGEEWALKQATKQVGNMRLQNMVMQARKIASHPFLFDWPVDQQTGDLVVNQDLVNASGKMLLLNRLLDALFERGHKVLIFSQFTTMLDIIEDWADHYKGFKLCRIDGSTSQEDRRNQMHEFNNGGDDPDACKLFLLSTRAGGLGINLVAADTVIFFDSDWNPQMDLQAQDRAHRIGQTRPVLVLRLATAGTVEVKILAKAGNKRKLEALVISQGKFGRVVDENGRVLLGRGKKHEHSTAEMAQALLELEGEEIDVATKDDTIISDQDLDILLDRSTAAFAREKGWSAGLGKAGAEGRQERLKKGEKTAFEVFVTAKDDAADGLASMFAGDGEKEEE